MTNLYSANAQEAKKDTYKLVGVSLNVPTAEQIAKMREKNPEYTGIPVSLLVEWEPMTYRIEGGTHGNKESDYVRLTKGAGVTEDAVAGIRAGGYPAIPSSAMYKTPAAPEKKDPSKQQFPIQRFLVAAARVGLNLSIDNDGSKTGTPGAIFTTDAGQLFECTSGYEDFPTWAEDSTGRVKPDWENPSQRYMRLPIARVKDFVAPEVMPVRHIEARDEGGEAGGAATSAVSSGATDIVALLKAAVTKIGIVGQTPTEVNEKAMNLVARNLGTNPVLGTTEVANAARNKQLVEFLVGKGVVDVSSGTVAVA